MTVLIIAVFVLWIAIALSAGRSAPQQIINASYTGKVTSFGTFQSYGTWGPTNQTFMIITTNDHSDDLAEVSTVGNWTRRKFKVGDHVVKRAGEARPHVQPPG